MEYKIIRSRRKTISIEIRSGEIVVRAPILVPKFAINKFVLQKADWINKYLQKTSLPSTIGIGKIMFGGVLRNLEFADGPNEIIFDGAKMIVLTSGNSTKLQNLKLKQFLIKESRDAIERHLKRYEHNFEVDYDFTIKMYKSKWGSCSPQNELTFNGKLIMAPDEVVEYVVVHELCHTRVKNHSKKFWNEVGLILPDYKRRRRWLRANHHLLDYENR